MFLGEVKIGYETNLNTHTRMLLVYEKHIRKSE
jgi:hypothetical protein